jgi:hypothetical protein
MELTPEQLKAYDRFIRARDKVKLVKTSQNYAQKYIPHRDYLDSVHIVGLNHPNTIGTQYQIAICVNHTNGVVGYSYIGPCRTSQPNVVKILISFDECCA